MIHPDALLSRLELVTSTGPDRWKARCPAHQDKTPSLSIRQADNRILLFDFGGCEVSDILAAIGLTWSDICPERKIPFAQAIAQGHRRQRRRLADIPATEYARNVLLIASADQKAGRPLSLADRATVEVAKRILQGDRGHG